MTIAICSFFKSQLQDLKLAVEALHDLETAKVATVIRSHQQIQDFFEAEIVNLKPPDNEQLAMSYYVEINKQLRLLSADLNLIQAARVSATLESRVKQASDRLKKLMGYCDCLIKLFSEHMG
jgi:hypothetical protein